MASRVMSLRSCARLASSAQAKHRQVALRCKSTRPDLSSLIDTASDMFVSLRWKAANALTASMTPDERDQLLEKFQPPKVVEGADDSEAPETPSTIAEAVAAAQAKEAQLQEGKWDKLKGEIYEEAEKAAQERVESDLAIQKSRIEKLKRDFEVEKKALKLATAASAAEELAVVQAEVIEQEAEDHHPVLGPIILDLGYKRLHRVSAQALSSIPVWEKQRSYRHARAKKMAEDKMKTLHLGIPGIIGLHEVRARVRVGSVKVSRLFSNTSFEH